MAFFQSAVGTLQTLVVALGAGLEIWKYYPLLVVPFPYLLGIIKGKSPEALTIPL